MRGEIKATLGCIAIYGAISLFAAGCSKPAPPVALSYASNSISMVQGESISTGLPVVDDGGASISQFSIESGQEESILIDTSTGEITVSGKAVAGVYQLDISATNKAGKTVFPSAIKIDIKADITAPSAIEYAPDRASVLSGLEFSTQRPTVIYAGGTLQFAFATETPEAITIDASSGVVSLSTDAPAGVFELSVTASNEAGSFTQDRAVTISIRRSVAFSDDILPIIRGRCAPCHTRGTGTENLTVYATAQKKIEKILDRINRGQGSRGFMPLDGDKLPESELYLFSRWQDDGLLES